MFFQTQKPFYLILAVPALTFALPGVTYAQSLETNSVHDEPLDEIIVTGSPLSRSVDEAITGVSVLQGEDLSNRLAATIGETLKTEPGVSSSFFGAGASRPIIRGQGGDRVRVLNNGIGSIDASSASPDHAVAAEPAQAERIEVLRGAALLRYGSSGAGGVINVIDGRIPDEISENLSGALRIGASSVDLGREVAASANQALGEHLVLHLDGTWRDADDYRIPGFAESASLRAEEVAEAQEHGEEPPVEIQKRLPNSQAGSHSFSTGLSFVGTNGHLGASLHQFKSEYGIPGGHHHEEEHDEHEEEDEEEEHEHDETDAPVSIELEQTRFDINGRRELNGLIETVQLFAGYADYKHKELEGEEIGTTFTNEGWEARIEALQAERGIWSAAYGLQLRTRDFAAIGEEAFVPPTTTKQTGLYMFNELDFDAGKLSDMHLEGALRYENTRHEVDTETLISSTSDGKQVDFDLFSFSLGGDIHLSDTVRLGLTTYRTERAPTTEELFSDGPHLATAQYQLGNAALDKEVASGIEAAFRHRHGGHFITLNAYYTDYADYIFEVQTDAAQDELPVFQYNAEDASFTGFELQGGWDIATIGTFDLKADGLAEFVRAKTKSGNLPRIPPLSILAGLEAENDRVKLRAEFDYAAEQNDTAQYETPSQSYTLVNMFASWRAPIEAQPVHLSLSVLNLFDEEARQHSSFLKEQIPLPGRNFRFSISSKF